MRKENITYGISVAVVVLVLVSIGYYFGRYNGRNERVTGRFYNDSYVERIGNDSFVQTYQELPRTTNVVESKSTIVRAEEMNQVSPINNEWIQSPLFGIWYLNGMKVSEYYADSYRPFVQSSTPIKAPTFDVYLDSGVVIRWGGHYWAMVDGTGASCDDKTFDQTQWNVSKVACVKGVVVQLRGENISAQDFETFKNFILKNK